MPNNNFIALEEDAEIVWQYYAIENLWIQEEERSRMQIVCVERGRRHFRRKNE